MSDTEKNVFFFLIRWIWFFVRYVFLALNWVLTKSQVNKKNCATKFDVTIVSWHDINCRSRAFWSVIQKIKPKKNDFANELQERDERRHPRWEIMDIYRFLFFSIYALSHVRFSSFQNRTCRTSLIDRRCC